MVKSLKGRKLSAPELVAIASGLPDATPDDWHVPKPLGVASTLLKVVNPKDSAEMDLRNRMLNAKCAVILQQPKGNPKTSSSAGWKTIVQLFPAADAPTKSPKPDAAPMRSQDVMTIPAADLKALRANWREYYLATTPEAQLKWEQDNQMGVKTADLSAIARIRNNKERAAALRELAAKEERGFEGYLQDRFGMTPLILGIPEAK